MRYKHLFIFIAGLVASVSFAADMQKRSDEHALVLQKQRGFFRLSFDNLSMPHHIQDMGLLGFNYFADMTPEIYGGMGGYAAITGTQGGLFVLGFEGGLHKEFVTNWWADAGLFVGGGGGRSSLVGGGLMLRPHMGISYAWCSNRIGLHYSYISFPSGLIHSKELGVDLDIPFDFYYVRFQDLACPLSSFSRICLCDGKCLAFERNDFAILLQFYMQKKGTKNVNNEIQDGTINVVGAEFDHYLNNHLFWWVKTAGAYHGIPNGYMDVLGGFGYHQIVGPFGLALVPQFGAGAGGGGNVDSGGGIIIQPQLGIELPISTKFSVRANGGYLWAPKGQLKAYTAGGLLIYHLDIANTGYPQFQIPFCNKTQCWRLQLFNQTYLYPQRAGSDLTTSINLVSFQIDQYFTPYFFFVYQAAAAYQGDHAGGYATGMIGPGLQTFAFLNERVQFFSALLMGAGGGGRLALAGGALFSPVLGLHYTFTSSLGMTASVSQIKAIFHDLNTTAFNLGITVRFGTLNRN